MQRVYRHGRAGPYAGEVYPDARAEGVAAPVHVNTVERTAETHFLWTLDTSHPNPSSLTAADLIGLQIQDAGGTWRSPSSVVGTGGTTFTLGYAGTFDTTTTYRVQSGSVTLDIVFNSGGTLQVDSGDVLQPVLLLWEAVDGTNDYIVTFTEAIAAIDDLASFHVDNLGDETATAVVAINANTVRLTFPSAAAAGLSYTYDAGGASFTSGRWATSQAGTTVGRITIAGVGRFAVATAIWNSGWASDDGPGGGGRPRDRDDGILRPATADRRRVDQSDGGRGPVGQWIPAVHVPC